MNADLTDFHGFDPCRSVLSVFICVLFFFTPPAGDDNAPQFDLYRADGPPITGPLVYLAEDWSLQVVDAYGLQEATSPQLQFAFNTLKGENGDTIRLSIQVVSAGRRNTEGFLIFSTLGGAQNLWAGEVGN